MSVGSRQGGRANRSPLATGDDSALGAGRAAGELADDLGAGAARVVLPVVAGLAGYALGAMASFFTVLGVGFIYEWKVGAMDW